MESPEDLKVGGLALWAGITGKHELDDAQSAQLLEACRAKDRLDQLDVQLRAEMDFRALTQANATANLLKQLLAALRLPDEQSGKRPQYRGARGVQAPSVPGGKVSSLERARAAKTG